MKAYFPVSLQISGRYRRQHALAVETIDPPPGREAFALRQIAARLRESSPGRPLADSEVLLLSRLNSVFRYLIRRTLIAAGCVISPTGILCGGRPVPPTLAAGAGDFSRCYPPVALTSDEEIFAAAVPELFILAVQSRNRAAAPLYPLFDPEELDAAGDWRGAVAAFDRLLVGATPAPEGRTQSLLDLLTAPLRAAPDSLAGQLDYVRRQWGNLLPEELLDAIAVAFARIDEEAQQRGPGDGHAGRETLSPGFAAGDGEIERFSPDREWMPNVVLLAKNAYVWLNQLSRFYRRPIERLDQVPDEEIDRIARCGFSSLWLIGLWERSPASAAIKRMSGNFEADASAYSLFDYVIAADLGGESALEQLCARCRMRGIRLACDVVPNHTGIDSRWVREHPDWYIQLDHPPWPSYAFSGPDLSGDPSTQVRIEDGYWNRSDAAVVFQHIQHGRTRYIYHGNDGTHLPWNDTAQLNFLLPEVREAMIQTIIAVARRFRIIRFDAAMTLAKKHFQRLWFPHPGGGAGVPGRAEYAIPRELFDQVFPTEFWREVVDRVGAEVPDTLLLAEAFWLMEGYFVRTLGMHRVYNSAFMNMLKAEENGRYRGVIRGILEFDSGILQRFVNFMSNPDEEPAAAQFGRGDKYFAVATLLATLPGLPMFGHGQVEGFTEKYGMEFRRPRYEEDPDAGFVGWHEERIFPLLRRRDLFSGAGRFALFDLHGEHGVDENVFVFSNHTAAGRSLVAVNNAPHPCGGRIRVAVPRRLRQHDTDMLVQQPLGEALALDCGNGVLWRCRDQAGSGEYLFQGEELAGAGLSLTLPAYGTLVLLDWERLTDDGVWGELCRNLAGRPAPSLDRLWIDGRYREEHAALRRILAAPATPDPGDVARLFAKDCILAPREIRRIARLPAPAAALAALLALLPPAAAGEDLAARFAATGLDRVAASELGHPEAAPLCVAFLRQMHDLDLEQLPILLCRLLSDRSLRFWLGWHRWEGKAYVNRERFERLLDLLGFALLLRATGRGERLLVHERLQRLRDRAAAGSWQVEKFCDFL